MIPVPHGTVPPTAAAARRAELSDFFTVIVLRRVASDRKLLSLLGLQDMARFLLMFTRSTLAVQWRTAAGKGAFSRNRPLNINLMRGST